MQFGDSENGGDDGETCVLVKSRSVSEELPCLQERWTLELWDTTPTFSNLTWKMENKVSIYVGIYVEADFPQRQNHKNKHKNKDIKT